MTNETRFDDITHNLTNLKIQAGTIGTSQVAIASNLTLITGLAADMGEVKSDIRQIKADIRNLEAGINETLRLLCGQN